MAVRTVLLAVLIALAFGAPAPAQDRALYEPGRQAAPGGGAADDGGRSTLLVVLGVLTLAGAAGTLVLALRAPRREPAAPEPGAPDERARRPRPVAGPPPLPAFGPGSGSTAPSGAPPPPPS